MGRRSAQDLQLAVQWSVVVCCLVMVVVGSRSALCHSFFYASVDSSSDGSCHCVCSHRYASQLACCRDGRDAVTVTFAMSIAGRWLFCCSSKRLQIDNIMDDGCFLWSHNICSKSAVGLLIIGGCLVCTAWLWLNVSVTAATTAQISSFEGGLEVEWSESGQYRPRYEVMLPWLHRWFCMQKSSGGRRVEKCCGDFFAREAILRVPWESQYEVKYEVVHETC